MYYPINELQIRIVVGAATMKRILMFINLAFAAATAGTHAPGVSRLLTPIAVGLEAGFRRYRSKGNPRHVGVFGTRMNCNSGHDTHTTRNKNNIGNEWFVNNVNCNDNCNVNCNVNCNTNDNVNDNVNDNDTVNVARGGGSEPFQPACSGAPPSRFVKWAYGACGIATTAAWSTAVYTTVRSNQPLGAIMPCWQHQFFARIGGMSAAPLLVAGFGVSCWQARRQGPPMLVRGIFWAPPPVAGTTSPLRPWAWAAPSGPTLPRPSPGFPGRGHRTRYTTVP